MVFRLFLLSIFFLNTAFALDQVAAEKLFRAFSRPGNMLLVSDGSGFTPINGKRTYDYGSWYILDASRENLNAPDALLWKWSPLEESTFTKEQRDAFIGARDGTFVGENSVLLTGSTGGVALVQIFPKKVLHYVNVGLNSNPHASALLPGGVLAVAVSDSNKIALVSRVLRKENTRQLASDITRDYPLDSAHGVVWDSRRKVLWALGKGVLIAYRYNGKWQSPELKREREWKLPSDGSGHNLSLSHNQEILYISTNNWTGTFSPEVGEFDRIGSLINVKSLGESRKRKPLLSFTVAEPDPRIKTPTQSWWSENIYFLDANGTTIKRTILGARIYKVRWK